MRLDVLPIVEVFRHPHVSDGELQREVGVGIDRDPLVGVHGSRVVQIGRDGHARDPAVGEPERQARRHLTCPAPRGGLVVAAPVQKHLGVLRDVVQKILIVALTKRLRAPCMLRAPVPALPGVGLPRLQSRSAEKLQQLHHRPVARMDDLGLPVPVLLHQDRPGAVNVVLALDLLRDDGGRLVPADAAVLRGAAGLGMAIAFRVPVLADQRVRDAVARERVPLVGDRGRRDQRMHRLFENPALVLEFERLEMIGGICGVVPEGPNAQDLVVPHVNGSKICADSEAAPIDIVIGSLVRTKTNWNHTVPPI